MSADAQERAKGTPVLLRSRIGKSESKEWYFRLRLCKVVSIFLHRAGKTRSRASLTARNVTLNAGSLLESLSKVGLDVLDPLVTDADTDQVLGDTRRKLVLIRKLLMCSGSRVNDERLGITDVGQVGSELQAVDESTTGSSITLDTKGEDTTETASEVLLGNLVRRVAGKTRVRNPRNLRASFKPFSECKSVLDNTSNTERKSLETLKQEERAKGVLARSQITHNDDTEVDGKSDGSESVPELKTVVTGGWLGELRELAALAPVKLSAVDDHTTDSGTVTTDPLGSRVHNNIGTVLDGANKVSTGTESIVDNQRNPRIVCNLGDGSDVVNKVLGVGDRLDVDGLGLGVNGSLVVLGLLGLDKLGGDAKTGEEVGPGVVRTTVEVRGGDNVVTSSAETHDDHTLSGLTGRGSESGGTTLKSSNSLLKHIVGGVHETRVAASFQAE